MWNLKNKINEQTKQKQTYRYREQTGGCQMGGMREDWMKKVKRLRSTKWQLQNSHGDVKYSVENTVINVVITVYGARWVWVVEILGGSLCKIYDYLTTTLCTSN